MEKPVRLDTYPHCPLHSSPSTPSIYSDVRMFESLVSGTRIHWERNQTGCQGWNQRAWFVSNCQRKVKRGDGGVWVGKRYNMENKGLGAHSP